MRVAKLTLSAAVVCLATGGPAGADPQGTQYPACPGKNQNEVRLSATLGSDGCPQQTSITTDPACLAVTYGSRAWPSIRWLDVSPQASQVRWQIDAVPGNAHAHLGSISLDWTRDAGQDTPTAHAGHASGTCYWYYRATAVGHRADGSECSVSLDPAIRFNPGGGGNIVTKFLFVMLGVATVALLIQLTINGKGKGKAKPS